MKQYIAGFLDADGTIGMSPNGVVNVEFYNADIKILQSIQKVYGGRIKTRKPLKKEHNVSHTLNLVYDKAYKLIEDVSPFMIHGKKKARADLIIKYYKKYTPRNGKYTPDLLEKKKWLVDKVKSVLMRGQGAY